MRVDDPVVLDLLLRAGAREGADPVTVRLPRGLVAECLSRPWIFTAASASAIVGDGLGAGARAIPPRGAARELRLQHREPAALVGSNVPTAGFVEAVAQRRPGFVGFSTLLTTTMPQMGRTIAALDAAGLRQGVRVVIGGAPVTPRFAKEIGADLYASTASEAAQLLRDAARGGRA